MLAVCILPGIETEVVSVFPWLETFTFAFCMARVLVNWFLTAAAAVVGLTVLLIAVDEWALVACGSVVDENWRAAELKRFLDTVCLLYTSDAADE